MKHYLPFVLITIALLTCLPVKAQSLRWEKGVGLSGGAGLDEASQISFGINALGGLRFNDYLSVGIGAGYAWYNALAVKTDAVGAAPEASVYQGTGRASVFGRGKVNFTKTTVSPFVSATLGGSLAFEKQYPKRISGFFYEPAVGCDFSLSSGNRISVLIGYLRHAIQYEHNMIVGGTDGTEMLSGIKKDYADILALHIEFYF